MKFLTKLFGNMSLDVNNLVDNVVTTKEEREAYLKELCTVCIVHQEIEFLLYFLGHLLGIGEGEEDGAAEGAKSDADEQAPAA